MTAAQDKALAQALIDAANSPEAEADIAVCEAEGAICERLDIPLNDTELGLTRGAVERIEAFVSQSLGTPWTYQDSGMFGTDAEVSA